MFIRCLWKIVGVIIVLSSLLPRATAARLQDIPGQTALDRMAKAIREKDLPTVKRLIQDGVNVNWCVDGCSLLFCAMDSSLAIQQELIAHGANVNYHNLGRTDDENTVLMEAIENAQPETVRLLLDHGARIDERSLTGKTALMHATYCKYALENTRLLLSRGAQINACDKRGTTALMFAAGHGGHPVYYGLTTPSDLNHLTALEVLLIHHARIDAVDKRGTTALMYAAGYGRADNVRVLLHYGAKVDVRDHDGWTVLMYVMSTPEGDDNTSCPNMLATLKVLIAAHARINVRDNEGETVLDHAGARPNQFPTDDRVYDLLYAAGARVSKGLDEARAYGDKYKSLNKYRPVKPPGN